MWRKYKMSFQYQGEGLVGLKKRLSDYQPELLISLFREMLRIRLVEQSLAERYSQDHMKTPIHLAVGQEAIAVGCAALLSHHDHSYCGHRTHAHYLAKGGDLNAMFSEFHCKQNGCAASRGGSMHLIDKSVGMAGSSAIVAGIVPIATGAALAAKMQKNSRIVFVFLGDAAMEEGAVWESINFAVLKSLPIVFVCENNYYSVCSPLDYRQLVQVPIYKKAEGFGLKSMSIDGNDILKVYETTKLMIDHIRLGKGPCFIEAHTYRWYGHHGDKEDFGYRSQSELEAWKHHDPIKMMRLALEEQNMLTAEKVDAMQLAILQEIDAAFVHAMNSPNPTAADLMTHVYSD